MIKEKANADILTTYSDVRRSIFKNVIDPMSQGNLRRLCENDPETVRDTDPFFRSILNADEAGKEKIRGFGELRVSLFDEEACRSVLALNQA